MLKIFKDDEEVANEIAKEMKHQLLNNQNPVFCLASGSTPQKSYQKFAKEIAGNSIIHNLKIVSLDEWVGIEQNSEGSCYQMLYKDLFSLIHLKRTQIEFFDGTSENLQQECLRIDQFVEQHPITFSLIGVGMNGHIGLNEPGCEVVNHSSVVDLSVTTKVVGQKYFQQKADLTKGITLGLGQIASSKRAIVAITGEKKANIAKEIFSNPNAKLPAQELLGYEHIDFFLDSEAAKYIKL